MTHEWVPTGLNHGTLQCKHCHCTDREAQFAIGMACPARMPTTRPNPLRLVGGTDLK